MENVNKTKNNQWITAGIKVPCKHKKSFSLAHSLSLSLVLYIYIYIYICSKTTNSPIIKAYYTQWSTILQKVIRKSKHILKLIKASGNKQKKTLWKIINKETGKSNLTKNI